MERVDRRDLSTMKRVLFVRQLRVKVLRFLPGGRE
jgi:hypothetical protein